MKFFKFFIYMIIITIPLFSFSGCYKVNGIEELAYVLAIGIDKADDNIQLTLQFATSGSEDSSSSSSQSTKVTACSIKCTSIDSGISLINSHISKKINLSHCQVIIFSEDLAKYGLEDYLDTLINNTELTTNSEILISKCEAKEFIENIKPSFESVLSKYYSSTLKTNQYVSYYPNMKLATFYCLLKDTYYQPYAPICNIESNPNSDTIDSVNGNFLAGNYKFEDNGKVQILGFAAFDKDKFVGEFTGFDALLFNMINNDFTQSVISIPSPFLENKTLDLSITSNKKTKCSVDYIESSPSVHIQIYLTGFGQSISSVTSYGSEESINKIQEAAEKYIKENMETFLYKTSRDCQSDICGFGRFAVKHYTTMEEWNDAKWLDNYKYCNFDVDVSFNIKAGNVFSKT